MIYPNVSLTASIQWPPSWAERDSDRIKNSQWRQDTKKVVLDKRPRHTVMMQVYVLGQDIHMCLEMKWQQTQHPHSTVYAAGPSQNYMYTWKANFLLTFWWCLALVSVNTISMDAYKKKNIPALQSWQPVHTPEQPEQLKVNLSSWESEPATLSRDLIPSRWLLSTRTLSTISSWVPYCTNVQRSLATKSKLFTPTSWQG